jgi:hypothetical protein
LKNEEQKARKTAVEIQEKEKDLPRSPSGEGQDELNVSLEKLKITNQMIDPKPQLSEKTTPIQEEKGRTFFSRDNEEIIVSKSSCSELQKNFDEIHRIDHSKIVIPTVEIISPFSENNNLDKKIKKPDKFTPTRLSSIEKEKTPKFWSKKRKNSVT